MSALPINDLTGGQSLDDAHEERAPGHPLSSDHSLTDTHLRSVAGDPSSDPATGSSNSKARTPDRTPYNLLAAYAGFVDEMESTRIANANRVRALRDMGAGDKEVARLESIVESIEALEHGAVLDLQRAMREHPLGPWVKSTVGIGLKQGARLLASIGDPYWNDLHERPRTVSELWAYSGYAVVDGRAPSRSKGSKVNWSPDARTRAFLCAESCIKQAKSPYRTVYDDARAKYADAVHAQECKRCGPKGKPAPPGSPLSLKHQHMRGLRAVSKEILRDLWLESKRLHENHPNQENQ